MNTEMQSLGSNIRNYRKKARLSQQQLADRTDISRNYLSLVENGKKIPSLKLSVKVAQELGVTPSALFENDPLLQELKQLSEEFGLDKLIESLNQLAGINRD